MKIKLLFILLIIPISVMSQFRLIKDLNTNSSKPSNFIEFNGQFYFLTENAGFSSSRIIVSNGFASGTYELVDNNNNPLINANGASVNDAFGILDGELFFAAQNLADGIELYKTDGLDNTAELVLDIRSVFGGNGSNPYGFVNLNSGLIFSANDGINGRELWFTDGTTSGTSLLKDIAVGGPSSNPLDLFLYNGNIYFTANDGINGNELWITDGTEAGTQLLKDIAIGVVGSTPRDFISYNGKVYFTANDGVNGRELWVTDGTSSGTQMVQDLNVGSTGSMPSQLLVFNGNLIFSANVPGIGVELVKMNPSESITSLGNINSSGDSNPQDLVIFNGFLYFSADNGTFGRELYRTNGFSSGTGIVSDINTMGSSNPTNFLVYNGNLYFAANDGTNGNELWLVDNSNGVSIVADFNVGSNDSNPVPEIVIGNEMIVTLDDSAAIGIEPWAFIDNSFQTFVPDDDFEQQLIDFGYDTVLDNYVPTANISNVQTLTLDSSSGFVVSDFTGLEGFSSLIEFTSFNNIETDLDLSQNPNLTKIEIFDPNLTNLSFSSTTNPVLEVFYIGLARLSTLDFSGYNTLKDIQVIANMPQLNSIDISNTSNSNLTLIVDNTASFSTLTADNASALQVLGIYAGSMTSLDLTTCPNITRLIVSTTQLQTLDLSSNSLLELVVLTSNQLTSLNIKNGTNGILTSFNSTGNSALGCIQVDDETAANDGNGSYLNWLEDSGTVYSENCALLSTNDFELSNFSIYPNPTQSTFFIENSKSEISKVEILDLNGRLVKTFNKVQESYSISELNPGLYFVNIKGENTFETKKIIKK